MSLPVQDLADYSQWLPGAVGPCRVARKPLVREVGVILERAYGFHAVDSAGSLAHRQFGSPGGRQTSSSAALRARLGASVCRRSALRALPRLDQSYDQTDHRQVRNGPIEVKGGFIGAPARDAEDEPAAENGQRRDSETGSRQYNARR